MATPKIRREQVAGMNIHYVNYSLDYFLDAQQRIGFKSIELWCAAPHVWLDHMRYYDAKEIRQKIESRGLAVHVLTPRAEHIGRTAAMAAVRAGGALFFRVQLFCQHVNALLRLFGLHQQGINYLLRRFFALFCGHMLARGAHVHGIQHAAQARKNIFLRGALPRKLSGHPV